MTGSTVFAKCLILELRSNILRHIVIGYAPMKGERVWHWSILLKETIADVTYQVQTDSWGISLQEV